MNKKNTPNIEYTEEDWGLRRSSRLRTNTIHYYSEDESELDKEIHSSRKKRATKKDKLIVNDDETDEERSSSSEGNRNGLRKRSHSRKKEKVNKKTKGRRSLETTVGIRFSSRSKLVVNYAELERETEIESDLDADTLPSQRSTKKGLSMSDEAESFDSEDSEISGKRGRKKTSQRKGDNTRAHLVYHSVGFPMPEDSQAIEWVMDVRYRTVTIPSPNATNVLGESEKNETLQQRPKEDAISSMTTIPPVKLSLEYLKSDQVEYLIKWRGLSHHHNTWETFNQLSNWLSQLRKLDIFMSNVLSHEMDEAPAVKGQSGELEEKEERLVEKELMRELWKEYKMIDRIICERRVKTGTRANVLTKTEYLVKWRSLPYSEVTWEAEETLLQEVGAAELEDKVQAYEAREWRNTRLASTQHGNQDKDRPMFVKMETQPHWLCGGGEAEKGTLLRDYQLAGLNWLAYSWHRYINTILADEMGLGKTIQTISFLSYLYHQVGLNGPFLLVVPLSTIHAWAKELAKWGPSMNAIMYVGDAVSRSVLLNYEFYKIKTSRKSCPADHVELDKSALKWNVLLTTYELILKDASVLAKIPWVMLIVDEAHRLKNAGSLLHQTLKNEFSFRNRLLITGTPLQNSLKELYALLTFLEPEKFPDSWETFEAGFLSGRMAAPDTEESLTSTEDTIQYLHKVLKPHLLRRLKKDVEKSLPQKKERILRVDLSPLQKLLYKWILTRNYKELNKSLTELTEGKENSAPGGTKVTSLLNIIGELKKAACHPYMFANAQTLLARQLDPEGLIYHSGKMVLLDALLKRLLGAGHRVLIFSQSVHLLDLLGEFLSYRSWPYLRLDGSVASDVRKRSIDRFNAPGSIYHLFLLSTRAGGLGINLETADTVILFDSDWNPQNDCQAMARVHRIGQKRSVNIYRLVSKHTVEEEILERAKKKMVLDHLVIQRMDTSGRIVLKKVEEGKNAKRQAKDMQSILMFGARALFKEDELSSDNTSSSMVATTESDRVLLHQLMLPSSISVKAIQETLTTSAETKDGSGDQGQKTAMMALLTRPSFQFDLDEVLSRAELTSLPTLDPDGNEESSESGAEDEFLDSFKVADLSGALSWAAIIPESERLATDKAELEWNERMALEEAKASWEKRQAVKENAIKNMKSSNSITRKKRDDDALVLDDLGGGGGGSTDEEEKKSSKKLKKRGTDTESQSKKKNKSKGSFSDNLSASSITAFSTLKLASESVEEGLDDLIKEIQLPNLTISVGENGTPIYRKHGQLPLEILFIEILNYFIKFRIDDEGNDDVPGRVKADHKRPSKHWVRRVFSSLMAYGMADVLPKLLQGLKSEEPDDSKELEESGIKESDKLYLVNDIASAIYYSCDRLLKAWQEQVDDEEKSGKRTEKKPTKDGRASIQVLRTYFYGTPVYPHVILKRMKQLDLLSHVAKDLSKGAEVKGDILFPIGKIKAPLGWNVPWVSEDDHSLLFGVWKYGFGSWIAIRDDPSLGLQQKFHYLDHDVPVNSEEGSTRNKIPKDEHVKRRVEYLLDQLELAVQKLSPVLNPEETEAPKRKKKKREGEDTTLSTPSKGSSKTRKRTPGGSSTHSQSHAERLQARNKELSMGQIYADGYSANDYLNNLDLTKYFKKLFKPVKKYLLALDELSEHDKGLILKETLHWVPSYHHHTQRSSHDTDDVIRLLYKALKRVGDHIQSIIKFKLDSSTVASSDEEKLIKELLIEGSTKEELNLLQHSWEGLEVSLWEFVKLCWPNETDAHLLIYAYRHLC